MIRPNCAAQSKANSKSTLRYRYLGRVNDLSGTAPAGLPAPSEAVRKINDALQQNRLDNPLAAPHIAHVALQQAAENGTPSKQATKRF
jgi:hypothetical protein